MLGSTHNRRTTALFLSLSHCQKAHISASIISAEISELKKPGKCQHRRPHKLKGRRHPNINWTKVGKKQHPASEIRRAATQDRTQARYQGLPYTGGHSSRVAASQGWVWRARPVMGCFDSTARDKPVPGANQEQTGQGHSTALKRSIL